MKVVEISQILAQYVDLNENDLQHISSLIAKDFPFEEIDVSNVPWQMDMLLVASAYLYSKCPGNSDKVVSFKEATYKLKKRNSSLTLMHGIREVKELGFIPQYCVVTSTTVLRNMKREYNPEYKEIFEEAIKYSKSQLVINKRQGRDPRAVAAACFYIASVLIRKPVTQGETANMFDRTEVTIRNNYQRIMPEGFEKRYSKAHKSDAPRVQCKDCVHLGDRLPKVERIRYKKNKSGWGWGPKKVKVSLGWECLANAAISGHVPSITYKRTCPKYEGKQE